MPPEWLFLGLLCFGVMLVTGLVIGSWVMNLIRVQEVFQHGIVTEATIRRRPQRHWVEISYRDFTGKAYRHSRRLTPSHYHSLPDEGIVRIYYSKRQPQVWAFGEDIERMRELRKQ